MRKTEHIRRLSGAIPFRPGRLAIAIGLLLILPEAGLCQHEAGRAGVWVGKQVVQNQANFGLRIGSQVIDLKHRLEVFRVEQVNGGWLWLKVGNLEGWARADEVVPVDEALEFFTNAIRATPYNAFAFTMRGVIWRKVRNDPDVALGDFNEAIRLDPTIVAAYLSRGDTLLRKENFDRAIADCNEAIRLDPNGGAAYALRGLVAWARKDYDKAIADYSEAIRLDPKDPSSFNGRAHVWSIMRNRDKAIADYSEAIRLDPKIFFPYFNRGIHRLSSHDYDRAMTDFTEAIRLNPKHADSFVFRGETWRHKRDYDKAIDDYTQAIRLTPKDAFALNARGIARTAKQEFDRAVADFNQAIRLNPRTAAYYDNRGVARSYQKEYDRAIADSTKALLLDPKRTSVYVDRAIVWLLRGSNEDAIVDSRNYLNRGDWKSQRAIFAALIGHFAARRAGKNDEARTFLADIQARGDTTAWPFPVVSFLRGELAQRGLLDALTNVDHVADVRCFLGLDLTLKGNDDAALTHYRWIKEHGTSGFLAHRIATGELNRLEQKEKPSPKSVGDLAWTGGP
jgi:tetratricopeptide (TPR) repeat protein